MPPWRKRTRGAPRSPLTPEIRCFARSCRGPAMADPRTARISARALPRGVRGRAGPRRALGRGQAHRGRRRGRRPRGRRALRHRRCSRLDLLPAGRACAPRRRRRHRSGRPGAGHGGHVRRPARSPQGAAGRGAHRPRPSPGPGRRVDGRPRGQLPARAPPGRHPGAHRGGPGGEGVGAVPSARRERDGAGACEPVAAVAARQAGDARGGAAAPGRGDCSP